MSIENINPLTQQPFSDSELQMVLKQAEELMAISAEIAVLETLLEQKKEKANNIQLRILPDSMATIGLNSFAMKTGAQILIQPFYQCSVSDKDPGLKEKALKWLRADPDGKALVKHEVKASLGTDAVKELASLRGFLNRKQITFKDGQSVNAATLKSFMKERIEAGKSFPLDIFKGYAGKIARIEMPTLAVKP